MLYHIILLYIMHHIVCAVSGSCVVGACAHVKRVGGVGWMLQLLRVWAGVASRGTRNCPRISGIAHCAAVLVDVGVLVLVVVLRAVVLV